MKVDCIARNILRLLGCSALLAASVGRAQLVNGDFATGDFTGWSITNTVGPETSYGLETGGSATEQVVPYDITGTGTTVNSAEFQVGEAGGIIGGGPLEGIVIYQYVPLDSGELTVSFDLASYSPSNNGGGTFQLLLDGNDVADYAIGDIGFHQTIRSSLSYTGPITGGTHEIGVAVLRAWGYAPDTPIQYLSDFQVSVVPEPSTLSLVASAYCLLLVCRFCRRND